MLSNIWLKKKGDTAAEDITSKKVGHCTADIGKKTHQIRQDRFSNKMKRIRDDRTVCLPWD